MYCHQCGAKTYGKYCSKCGTKLITVDSNLEPPPQDWANEIRYEVLLSIPEVRDLVARHASQAQKRMSADDFLELCDKAFVPITGVSLAKVGAIVQPIYATLGIKTGKIRKELFTEPVGKALIAAICSLARHGQSLNKVEQGEDGCLLKAGIPSDIWSFRGDILVTIQHQEQGSSVEATTIIKGQLYDWGKSKRILTELFDDIKNLPV
jgi:hypothetical protein